MNLSFGQIRTSQNPRGNTDVGDASPHYHFQTCFDEYIFSIISNLFDNNKLYALSTHTPNQKCTNKMYHIW